VIVRITSKERVERRKEMKEEASFFQCSVENGLAVIAIDRPPLNVLSFVHYYGLCKRIIQLIERREAKAIILTGNDKAFISGADIKDISNVSTPEKCEEQTLQMKDFFRQIEKLKRPVIAAIHGNCFGGGLELALSCHLRLASKKAKFGLPEIGLGTIPSFGGTQRLPRIVGRTKALELILTGRLISADEAFRIGLINEIGEPEDLLSRAKALGREIADKSALAVEAAIEATDVGLDGTLDQGLILESHLSAKLIQSEGMKEGLAAFFERRKPVFRDA
jgi:enoyl-CoA hydratase